MKISVNGGACNLIPASAIEVGPYNDTRFPALDSDGLTNNSNTSHSQNSPEVMIISYSDVFDDNLPVYIEVFDHRKNANLIHTFTDICKFDTIEAFGSVGFPGKYRSSWPT